MKTIKPCLALFLLLFWMKGQAQETEKVNPKYFYAFSTDSLRGFDLDAANKAMASEQYFGKEHTVKLYYLKRAYINNKYNLWPKPVPQSSFSSDPNSKITIAACNNEDFEASNSGTIGAQNQVSGWTITRGDVFLPNDACNLSGCCPNNPVESYLIDATNGYLDPIIGSCYPIYSVFGTNLGDPNGPVNNPHLSQAMYGNKVLRINSSALGSLSNSVEKLSKTIVVSANNTLFQFAYIFVTSTGHACCSASAFQFKLTNVTSNSVLACPGYTTTGPTPICPGNSVNLATYHASGSCAPTGTSVTTTNTFNKWKIIAVDLSPYIGQTITLDITVSDCDASGHYGYAYIDAQCGPMAMMVNNQPIYSNTVIASSCYSVAALSAPGGFYNYNWSGPGGFTGTTSAITTTVPGTYIVSMGGGQCSSTSMTVNLTFGNSLMNISSSQSLICIGQSVTLGSTAMSSYTWTTGANTQSITVAPTQSTIYAVAATDASNCVHAGSVAIVVSDPTLTISSPVPTICDGETIVLSASGVQTYTWSTGSNGSSISVSPTVNTTYSASGTDMYGCLASNYGFSIGVSPCLNTIESEKENLNINLFPNPNKGEFTVLISEHISQGTLELYSQDGKLVYSQKLAQGKNKVKLEKLSSGIYFYSVLDNSVFLKRRKLQIE